MRVERERRPVRCSWCGSPWSADCNRCRDRQSQARRRAERHAEGRCVVCGSRPPIFRARWCQNCRIKQAKRYARRRAERIAEGACATCGQCVPEPGRRACRNCNDHANELADAQKTRRLTEGVCRYCGELPLMPGVQLCRMCADDKAQRRRNGGRPAPAERRSST